MIRTMLLIMLLVGSAPASSSQALDDEIVLPLEIYLVRDLEIEKDRTKMTTWVSKAEVETQVFPEINRIWKQANIRWQLIATDDVAADPDQVKGLVELIADHRRNSSRDDTKEWADELRKFDRKLRKGAPSYRLFLFPYIGHTLQGTAFPSNRFAVLGAWTNKPSRGKRPPQPVKLVEAMPLDVGSLGRTAAHELGHLLSLKHNDSGCANGCLMGDDKQGYLIPQSEIDAARAQARRYLSNRK